MREKGEREKERERLSHPFTYGDIDLIMPCAVCFVGKTAISNKYQTDIDCQHLWQFEKKYDPKIIPIFKHYFLNNICMKNLGNIWERFVFEKISQIFSKSCHFLTKSHFWQGIGLKTLPVIFFENPFMLTTCSNCIFETVKKNVIAKICIGS